MKQEENNLPVLHIDRSVMLPDGKDWQLRFEVKSESSDNLYTIAQNKKKKHWGCSCFGYRRTRNCKHLKAIGLPGNEVPYEARIEN
jgi:hypothetical protein